MRLIALACVLLLGGSYGLMPSDGAGDTSFSPPRRVDAADIALPAGYRIEAVTTGLTFPTAVAFDGQGVPHVVEAGYSYGEMFTPARLLRIEASGAPREVAVDPKGGPWTGAAWHDGAFYVARGSVLEGGAILRVAPGGAITPLITGLPSFGDHHTNGPAIGPDGWIYFAQGTATNSGVVGSDNRDMGWLDSAPNFHDLPCRDVTLSGRNFDEGGKRTGAFLPFGTASQPGQVIKGQLPCSGAVMRMRPDGSGLELVAWGFRNPFGLAFSPQGRLFVTDNMYDERGSRPVFGAGDLLHAVSPGAWHGWPDYHGARRLDEPDRYDPPTKPVPTPLLAVPPGTPPKPRAVFGVHASANGFDFSRNSGFGHVGQAFVALFGDQAPATGKVWSPVGVKLVRVDPDSGLVEDFAVNRGKVNGPASWQGSAGLERPVAARFDPSGRSLYLVDFGVMTVHGKQFAPRPGTGVLWRIWREEGR